MKNIFKYKGFLIVVSLFFGLVVQAQVKDTSDIMMGMIKDGDTIIHKNIQEIWVMPEREFENRRDRRRYNRLVSKVKKVLPYAKLAGDMLQQYEPVYMELESEREKKKLMKDLEQQLLDQYKDEMKRMSISEGRILLKLIDREADRTSYTLIKEFRGGFSAFFWQGIARLFGSDLKSEYDPEGEDRVLEEIVTLVEVGYL
ncbi:protein of unknown function [Tangfeifania diversioriginum]|uniref:DUF4294 domain-containing protein n=1 Tax=Tangfeifania diversioriginum TaxID=1168035 RepID=A0A1M6MER5_9BACT|nr:DUF4294 domain-containing protein [Tangfeifania diversioriginum]SHJ81846.1 protein of unknown function [Tangfeifania diversioriginum]